MTADEEEGELILEAGRGGVYIRSKLEANVQQPGTAVVDCAHLSQIKLGDKLSLESDSKKMKFKSGRIKGEISCRANMEDIESQRPLEEFEADIALPAEVFKNAVSRATFTSALPNTTHGVRLQAGEDLKVSATDQYRATLYHEQLAVGQDRIDILLKPSFIQTALSRMDDIQISIGAHKGIFKISTDAMEIYHPSIQLEPEDIEEWIKTGIDYESRQCLFATTAEQLTDVINEASSIVTGSLGFDTRIDCLIKGQKLMVRVNADHGQAQSSLKLESSDAEKVLIKLSSRYFLEMLRLVKAGDMEVGVWNDFVMLQSNSGKFTALIPTVA